MASRRSSSLRYAKALFQLADEVDSRDAIGAALTDLVALLASHPGLRNSLFRPLHPAAQRRAVLEAIAQSLDFPPIFANFCRFLIDQRRIAEMTAIRDEYEWLVEEAAGRRHGAVTTAAPLSDSQLERLRGALSRRLACQVELSARVDPSLLGGMTARVGHLVIDGSLRSRLAQLRVELLEGS